LPTRFYTQLNDWGDFYIELRDAKFRYIGGGVVCRYMIFDSTDQSIEIHYVGEDAPSLTILDVNVGEEPIVERNI
jgi:hypothetical protein